MSGETNLEKLFGSDQLSHIISDVNDASRHFFLSNALIVIPNVLFNVSADNSESTGFELPGRNNFLVHIVTNTGTITQMGVKLQGSIIGTSSNSNWSDIGSAITTTNSITGFTDPRPFRYYRLRVSTPVLGGTINAHFSAIKN